MRDLVGNPKDRFSHNEAHIIQAAKDKGTDQPAQIMSGEEIRCVFDDI